MDCNFNCETFNEYRADGPYPFPEIKRPNLHYAKLISGAFAGKGSEATAIGQYTTHYFYLSDYPDVHTAYYYIPLNEMMHYNFLGQLIRSLGLTVTIFSYETNQFWSGSFPNYQYNLKEILKSDIEDEKHAIAHYQRLIGDIADTGIQALFKRIILDERKHVEILTGLYEKYF